RNPVAKDSTVGRTHPQTGRPKRRDAQAKRTERGTIRRRAMLPCRRRRPASCTPSCAEAAGHRSVHARVRIGSLPPKVGLEPTTPRLQTRGYGIREPPAQAEQFTWLGLK